MDIKGSRTEQMLEKAFSRELLVRARYNYYAETARQQGLRQVADILEAIASNEAEHATREFHFLGGSPHTDNNIEIAVAREFEEAHKLYPEAEAVAREEGFFEIADFFNRMAKVEQKHGENLQAVLKALNTSEPLKGKTVGHSAVRLSQTMMPSQTNPLGFVHGGELMKMMDNTAAIVALRHSQYPVVTAQVDTITFKTPVHVGELVTIDARLTFVSHATMETSITATAENILSGEKKTVLTATFIFVALDTHGKVIEVPPLIISTEEEEKLFAEGQARYNARKQRTK
ncbi:MAG: ferritin family protein [Dehalococcoidia bacterium]|jgi:acyl-CoA hydrolase